MSLLILDTSWASVLRRRFAASLAVVLAIVTVAGCNVDYDKIRRDHAKSSLEEMSARTAKALGEGKAIGLDECVRIALENNLDVQVSRISTRLAGLDRKIAFSNFLPHVDVSATYGTADRHQSYRAGGGYSVMSDRTYRRAVVSAQMPILAPETWFLYEAFKKGESIKKLLAKRTRDIVRLQVTSLYFACLSQEKSQTVLKQSLVQARMLMKEMSALSREGLATPAQLEQARTLVMVQDARLEENARLYTETKSELLEAMGLSPMGRLKLKAETILPVVKDQKLADAVLYAMLHRPELQIADRTVEVRKDETRIAIAQFLPRIVGFANLTSSSDSFLKHGTVLAAGISGVMSVFDGFANVFGYRAAKERQKQSVVQREQSCMKIMVEVIRARSRFDQAADDLKLAQQELRASEVLRKETEASWREGIVVTSGKLDAVTRHVSAQANVSIAEFRCHIAAATLMDVMGISTEGSKNAKVN